LRLGYAIAHPDRLQRWQALREPVNTLAAAAAAAVVRIEFQQQLGHGYHQPGTLFQGLAQVPFLQPLTLLTFYWFSRNNQVLSYSNDYFSTTKIAIASAFGTGRSLLRVAVRSNTETSGCYKQILAIRDDGG